MMNLPSSTLIAEVADYAALQRQVHDALLAEHPEWIERNGDCPTCDDYDRRFAELLSLPSNAPRRTRAVSAYSPPILRTGTESFTGPIGRQILLA